MKNNIPVWQLKDNISGVRVDRINDAYITSKIDYISKLHRKDHFICLMLAEGNAELLVDFKTVHLTAGSLVFLSPGQIQQMVKFKNNSKGWVLYLDYKLVDEYVMLIMEDSLLRGPLLQLSETDISWFISYFGLLVQTYYDETLGSFLKPSINALVEPCIYKIASVFQIKARNANEEYSQRSIELTKKFKGLVRKHYRDLKKPNDYANLMSFSISYLNDTIKSVTGFTTSYFIQQEMLREAQRLLCYTDLSIKEISVYLGYDDTKYFNRIFNKLTTIPPGRFRIDFKSLKTSRKKT